MDLDRARQTALWAGLAAFFGSLLAVGVFDALNPDAWVEYLGALLVSAITAGAVYSKARLDAVRAANGGAIHTTRNGDA